MPDDLAPLRLQFPAWQFGAAWVTANSGPDQRRVWAAKDGVLLTAWSAAELAALLT